MDPSATATSRQSRRIARAEAAAWIVRLHGPYRSEALEAAFRDWLAANPENARQFERVTEVWDAGSAPAPSVPRVSQWESARPPQRRVFSAGWAVAALLLVICGAGFALNELWLNPSYATHLGEQRVVRLSDGTRLSLNSNTRVEVSYRSAERRVRLARGEAIFEVAHDAERPFRVIAGDHQVTALGTTFVVRHETDRTAVTLVEGKVAVRPVTTGTKVAAYSPGASANAAEAGAGKAGSDGQPASSAASTASMAPTAFAEEVILAPGERLTLAAHTSMKLDAPSIEALTAWRRGEVMLDRTALADAVAEMNRYEETHLVIEDPAIAALRVSGIYHAGDSEIFAQNVARLYGLEVVRDANRIYLRATSAAGSDQSVRPEK